MPGACLWGHIDDLLLAWQGECESAARHLSPIDGLACKRFSTDPSAAADAPIGIGCRDKHRTPNLPAEAP